jgi:hypothetical protein
MLSGSWSDFGFRSQSHDIRASKTMDLETEALQMQACGESAVEFSRALFHEASKSKGLLREKQE